MPELIAFLLENPSYALAFLPFAYLIIQQHHLHRCIHRVEEKLDNHMKEAVKRRREFHKDICSIREDLAKGEAYFNSYDKRLERLEHKE